MYRIMVVDDDVNGAKSLARILGRVPGYKVDMFHGSAEALDKARSVDYDVVISDLRMPGKDGVTFLSLFKKKQPDALRVILSGHCDKESLYGAINVAQAVRYIEKPCNPDMISRIIDEVLADRMQYIAALKLRFQIS